MKNNFSRTPICFSLLKKFNIGVSVILERLFLREYIRTFLLNCYGVQCFFSFFYYSCFCSFLWTLPIILEPSVNKRVSQYEGFPFAASALCNSSLWRNLLMFTQQFKQYKDNLLRHYIKLTRKHPPPNLPGTSFVASYFNFFSFSSSTWLIQQLWHLCACNIKCTPSVTKVL